MSPQTNRQKNEKSKITLKQIAALICVVLLIGIIVGASVAVCLSPDDSGQLFAGWLGAVIGLPILLWLLVWSFLQLKKRRDENRPPQDETNS